MTATVRALPLPIIPERPELPPVDRDIDGREWTVTVDLVDQLDLVKIARAIRTDPVACEAWRIVSNNVGTSEAARWARIHALRDLRETRGVREAFTLRLDPGVADDLGALLDEASTDRRCENRHDRCENVVADDKDIHPRTGDALCPECMLSAQGGDDAEDRT
jgi:hypothetical protein